MYWIQFIRGDQRWKKMKDDIKINIIILVILIICLAVFSQWCIEDSRSDWNMVYIEEGYCYDKNTKIIYI